MLKSQYFKKNLNDELKAGIFVVVAAQSWHRTELRMGARWPDLLPESQIGYKSPRAQMELLYRSTWAEPLQPT